MNSLKNCIILIILISFLCFIVTLPVTCIFKSVTGFNCATCGLTRSFLQIIHGNFLESVYQNILGFPTFIFVIYSLIRLFIDIATNKFKYITDLINFLGNRYVYTLLFILLFVSFVFNNLK